MAAGVELLLTDGLVGRLPPQLAANLRNASRVHVLRVRNSTVRHGVTNLAGIQRVNAGDTFDLLIDVRGV